MGTLDGLREEIAKEKVENAREIDHVYNAALSACVRIIDAYEREHPGLEDWTIKCCRCGKPGRPHDPRWLYDQALIERPIPLEKAHVCPNCERPGDVRDD